METRYFIGIDIGGTNTKISVVSEIGEITNLRRFFNKDIDLTTDSFLFQISRNIQEINEISHFKISGIGISTPGLQMGNGQGTLFSINMPILNNIDLKEHFKNLYHLPVVVNNDLVAHSLAESKFGVGKGVERFLSVSLGTGIGHTFILNGVPQISMNGVSGDSGRMILDPNSTDLDSTGVNGSAEAMCGVKAIETLALENFSTGLKHSAQEIITMAREEKDPIAIEIMSTISRRLALLLVNLSSIYFPYLISLTGGQTEAGSFFIDVCQTEFNERSLGFFDEISQLLGRKNKIKIVKSEAGGLAGLIGSIVPLIK
jgi:glucokinase